MAPNQPLSIEMLNSLPRINDARFSADGRFLLYSASEGSQGALYARARTGRPFPLSTGQNVRGSIGYGGGDFTAGAGQAVFCDRSGSLFAVRIARHAQPARLTRPMTAIGSPELSPDGQWVLAVFQEDERGGLAVAPSSGPGEWRQVAAGADFYMQPAWHPSGNLIAWAEWDHPAMPWEASRIKLAELGGIPVKSPEGQLISGSAGQSASQPRFSADGQWLSAIVRHGDWDDLVLYHLKRREWRTLVKGEGFHLRLPQWVQGMRSYAWQHSGRAIIYTRYAAGAAALWQVDIASGAHSPIEVKGVKWITQLDASPVNEDLVFLASAPAMPKGIGLIHEGQFKLLSTSPHTGVDLRIQPPQEVEFDTGDSQKAYAFLYTPAGRKAPWPLVIHIHGGPTAASPLSFSSDAAWFTSRGYAYAQLNYRGSSGYGYAYQEALRHQWGIVDVEDTYHLARHLLERGIAHPGKIALMGSSAGGYTVLRALMTYAGFFKAGICSYGVSDLLADAQNTHKFERYYHRFLTGLLPAQRTRFIERSPIHHIERIQDPVALFHGDADPVVSVDQTLEIYAQLKANHVPCTLKIYEGEGHGFREPQHVADFYNRVERFLKIFVNQ